MSNSRGPSGCRCAGRLVADCGDLTGGRIARVISCIDGERTVLLHAFVKKSQKTPAFDLELTLKRRKELT